MKMAPSKATMMWREDGMLKGEWSDLSTDDEDRPKYSTVLLYAQVPEGENDVALLNTALCAEFDRWVKETR